MNLSLDLGHTLESTNPDTPNTPGERFCQRCPAGFDDQLDDNLQNLHPGIVALSGRFVKEGKDGYDLGGSAIFSRLFKCEKIE
jgi:hypothetical protein